MLSFLLAILRNTVLCNYKCKKLFQKKSPKDGNKSSVANMIDHSYNPNTFSDEKSIASHSFINTGFPGGVEFSTCVNLGPHSIFLRSSLML